MSKFYVGQVGVKTVSGHEVVILATDAPGTHPVIGYLKKGDNTAVASCVWDVNGRLYNNISPSSFDLVIPKRKITRTVWVNVYEEFIRPWGKENMARKNAQPRALVIAHPVTFTVEVDEV